MSFHQTKQEQEEVPQAPSTNISPSSSPDAAKNTKASCVPITPSPQRLNEKPAQAPKRATSWQPTASARLTLSDLKRAGPEYETDAETSILKSLENEEGDTYDDPEVGVLAGVPDDILEERSRALPSQQGSMQVKHVSATKGWQTAVALLTEQLQAMQDQASVEADKERNKAPAEVKTDNKEVQDAADHWDMIRQAVHNKNKPSTQDNEMNTGTTRDRDIMSGLSLSDVVPNEEESPSSPKRKGCLCCCPPGRCIRPLVRNTKIIATLSIEFLKSRKGDIKTYCRRALIVMLLALAIASILFYGFGNPQGVGTKAAVSWWIIFLAIRHVITFSLAQATQLVCIDLMCMQTKWMLMLTGPAVTLLIAQSRGWPFIMFFWGVYDLCLLYGDHAFASHWLYYQEPIKMCNAENPSGGVPGNAFYGRLIACVMIFGVAVALKRVWLSRRFGSLTSDRYGSQLTEIMCNIVLISEVASLSRVLEEASHDIHDSPQQAVEKEQFCWESFAKSSLTTRNRRDDSPKDNNAQVRDDPSQSPSALPSAEKEKVWELLDAWEEPEVRHRQKNTASISDILQFKRAINTTNSEYPFTLAFGPASNREQCIDSSVHVFERLLVASPEQQDVSFETIATIALSDKGELDDAKTRSLVRLFRPDRDGRLSMIDFVKSCDGVYKELRFLQAAVANSSQIDHAFETIFNVFFYVILCCVLLAILGLDPLALFVSLSGIIVGFAFMIGSASAKYFEGILFIFIRHPYDIGDRIAVSNVEKDTDSDGSSSWFVEKVTLFTTTVRFATTNEVATYSNGSLADSRIINAARSPKAIVYIYLKFDSDIPYEQIGVFRKKIENFVKARPREWIGMTGFRATKVEAELGYVQYSITLQHRESWQKLIAILQSKAELSSHCSEVQNELGMKYIAPPLPVHLEVDRMKLKDISSVDTLLDDSKLSGLAGSTSCKE